MAWDKPAFQIGDCVYFKNKQPGNWDLKWRPRYRIVCIECNGHFTHIENQATGKIWSCNVTDIILEPPIEFWNADTQFGRAGWYVNHPANLPTVKLTDTTWYTKKKTALLIINTHLHYSTIFMLAPTTNSSWREFGESVIFQPVLQAYPTWHSWIIRAHVSLGNLECHWKTFNRQCSRTQQLLHSLDQQPSAPTQLLSTLQVELSNIEDIYNSGKTTIISAIKLLQSNQPQTHICHRRSLLPFLGDALSWLTGTATTKDINNIKTRIINKLLHNHHNKKP